MRGTDQKAFLNGVPGGIGNDRLIEIEINGGIIFDDASQGYIRVWGDTELHEAVRGRLVHVGIGQQNIVEDELDDALSAQIPGVWVAACAGANVDWVVKGRKCVANQHRKGGVCAGVLETN